VVANQREPHKKYFTVAQANATLPLVRAIVTDITTLARELDERQERIDRLRPSKSNTLRDAYREEVDQIVSEMERSRRRLVECVEELTQLGIEIKDIRVGLVDFPCWVGNREVYLCWRLGEPEVGFWHELNAGFAGRQELINLGSRGSAVADAARKRTS